MRADGDPRRSRALPRNLSNQFELPRFASIAGVLLIIWNAVGPLDVVAAWVFFVGRVVHTLVQTLTDDVALHGQVFTINTIDVVMLMGRVVRAVSCG